MDIPSIREYSDIVEQYSIDEAFVDMTASCHMFGTPEETAEQIKDRIKDELGFTVNIGKYASIGIIRIHQNYHYIERRFCLTSIDVPHRQCDGIVCNLISTAGHAHQQYDGEKENT